MDEIWVPTEWNKKIFVSYLKSVGFMDPAVHVIPEAVDIDLFNRQKVKTPKSSWDGNSMCELHSTPAARTTFEFLSIFKWERRKGWDILLDSYWTSFSPSDDVLLRLHTYVPSWVRGETNITRIIENYAHSKFGKRLDELAAISWEKRQSGDSQLSRSEVRDLYASADAFVLPTRGEGWGLPIAEAMSMEVPVITSNFSGPAEYCRSENTYLIPMTGEYDELGYAIPDGEALGDLMVQVVKDSCPTGGDHDLSKAQRKAQAARKAISLFSPGNVVEAMKIRLKVLASERGYF